MKIKVCGLKYPDNIKAIEKLNPEYMGFIFYDRSPRFAAGINADALSALPASIIKTGVFVNESEGQIEALIDQYGFGAVQLHGEESPEFSGRFKGRVQVLKAFGVNEDFDFTQLKGYVGKVDYFLFDTKTSAHGGSGKTFNWDILNKYNLNVPFFLSGGLSLDNLEQISKIANSQFYGVDLNSRFEIEPGLKDIEKLKQAFSLIKQNNTHEVRS